MARELEEEVCECKGCAGEVSVFFAEYFATIQDARIPWNEKSSGPFCCVECFQFYEPGSTLISIES